LAVDDSGDAKYLLSPFFTGSGYVVERAANVQKALALTFTPDCGPYRMSGSAIVTLPTEHVEADYG